jgi:hypothetical protein
MSKIWMMRRGTRRMGRWRWVGEEEVVVEEEDEK